MGYDLNRFVNVSILLSSRLEASKLFEVILQEAMIICNCDGGTIYSYENKCLSFKHMITKSKNITYNSEKDNEKIPSVPIQKSYVCAYAYLERQRLNIPDVYESDRFDFSGAKEYDSMNGYRTKSMLVIPLAVEHGGVVGVLQLINAMDSAGNVIPFTEEQEHLVMALASMSALYIENRKLKALM